MAAEPLIPTALAADWLTRLRKAWSEVREARRKEMRDAWDDFGNLAYSERDRQLDPVVAGDEAPSALRVVRGGSWGDPSWFLDAAFRVRNLARNRDGSLGFRVVCGLGPEHGS